LSAVALELVPPMVAAEGTAENVAALVGFFLGVAVLIGLGVLLPEEEEDGEHGTDEGTTVPASPASPAVACCETVCEDGEKGKLKHSRTTLRRKSTASFSQQAYIYNRLNTLDHSDAGAVPLLAEEKPKPKAFPASLLFAVTIDACMDGLLIGIASAANETSGELMAIALAVEMGFLGLTLATALAGQPKSKALPAVVAAPALLILAAATGGLFAGALAAFKVFRIGLLSFGASALLFMVAEELLLEAHKEDEDHIWWVDVQLYVGFMCSVYLAKCLK